MAPNLVSGSSHARQDDSRCPFSFAVTTKYACSSRMLSSCYPVSPGSRAFVLLISCNTCRLDTNVAPPPLVVSFISSLLSLTPCLNRGLLRFTRTWQIVSRRATVGVSLSVIPGLLFGTATHSFYHPRLVAYLVPYVVYLFSTLFGFLISEMETRLLVDVLPGALDRKSVV